MQKNGNRVLHLTLEKCGSQWVRDVLTAPEVVACSGLPHSGISINLGLCSRLEIPEGTFSGPIYAMNQWEWQYWKHLGDKAIVVLRDPRDVMISLMFSWLYSHGSNDRIDLARQMLHELPTNEEKVARMIAIFGNGAWLRMYLTWFAGVDSDALVVRYEAMVVDQHSEFRKIFDWLGWNVSQETLEAVVNRLSFESRSGRKPGITDKFSHYRCGVAGDWRNHFTRKHGELWELLYPGFLFEIKYEKSNDWWHSLPDSRHDDSVAAKESLGKPDTQTELIDALQSKLRQLQQELVEKEKVIQDIINARKGEVPVSRETFLDRLRGYLRKSE